MAGLFHQNYSANTYGYLECDTIKHDNRNLICCWPQVVTQICSSHNYISLYESTTFMMFENNQLYLVFRLHCHSSPYIYTNRWIGNWSFIFNISSAKTMSVFTLQLHWYHICWVIDLVILTMKVTVKVPLHNFKGSHHIVGPFQCFPVYL